MRYKMVEVQIATKTINPADPTLISKKVGEEVVGSFSTMNEAEKELSNIIEQEEKSEEMALAMCGGDTELLGPRNTIERFVVDEVEQKVFLLGIVETGVIDPDYNIPEIEPKLLPIKGVKNIGEMFKEGWTM